MEIQIHQYGKKWGFEVLSGTHTVMQSTACYAHKRSAIKAARRVAKSKLKVVVPE